MHEIMEKSQSSSCLEEDEYCVDEQGFLLNGCSQSNIDSNNKSSKEDEVDVPVLGYDLSPFSPSDDIKFFQKVEDECCFTSDATTASSWREEKVQEESLLQKGGTEEQLARIEMYNRREVDSDSDDDDYDEDVEQDQVEDPKEVEMEKVEPKADYDCYTGLPDEPENEDEDYDIEDKELVYDKDLSSKVSPPNEFGLMETHNTDPSNFNDESGEKVELSVSQFEYSTSGTGVEETSSKPPFAAVVPLLKPPPKEKMEAYLNSKGWNRRIQMLEEFEVDKSKKNTC
jgi:hypothetical protein